MCCFAQINPPIVMADTIDMVNFDWISSYDKLENYSMKWEALPAKANAEISLCPDVSGYLTRKTAVKDFEALPCPEMLSWSRTPNNDAGGRLINKALGEKLFIWDEIFSHSVIVRHP